MVLGATDRYLVLSLSKFYSSGDPLFLGHSPSLAFSTNELFLVPTDFGAISRPMWCLQSNSRTKRRSYGAPPIVGESEVSRESDLSRVATTHQKID
jgi:hypothetical protein